jgi:hypothetical protein
MKPTRKANSQRWQSIGLALSVSTSLAGLALAMDPLPAPEGLRDAFPAQQHYSPYTGRNFPTRVFWGDTHELSRSLHGALAGLVRPAP